MCRLPDDTMDAIDKCLIVSLGLDYMIDNSNPVAVKPESTLASNNAEKDAQIKELKYRLDCANKELEVAKEANAVIKEKAAKAVMYEKMYNDILNRLTGRQ